MPVKEERKSSPEKGNNQSTGKVEWIFAGQKNEGSDKKPKNAASMQA